MFSFEDYIYSICIFDYTKAECAKTALHEYPITKAKTFIVDNERFIDSRFAVDKEQNIYRLLVFKCCPEGRTLAFDFDLKTVTSDEVEKAFKKILEEMQQ